MTLGERAQKFLQLAALGEVHQAFQEFVHPDFIHHNPYFEGSRSALLHAMHQDHQHNPNLSFETASVYTDQQNVIVHSKVNKKNSEIVVVHILRFQGDKIIELWDIGHILPDTAINQNGWR